MCVAHILKSKGTQVLRVGLYVIRTGTIIVLSLRSSQFTVVIVAHSRRKSCYGGELLELSGQCFRDSESRSQQEHIVVVFGVRFGVHSPLLLQNRKISKLMASYSE
jgi:hypothetical protein